MDYSQGWGSGSGLIHWFLGCRIRIGYFFHRIRILPVTADIQNYFHLYQNIDQNQQIQATTIDWRNVSIQEISWINPKLLMDGLLLPVETRFFLFSFRTKIGSGSGEKNFRTLCLITATDYEKLNFEACLVYNILMSLEVSLGAGREGALVAVGDEDPVSGSGYRSRALGPDLWKIFKMPFSRYFASPLFCIFPYWFQTFHWCPRHRKLTRIRIR